MNCLGMLLRPYVERLGNDTINLIDCSKRDREFTVRGIGYFVESISQMKILERLSQSRYLANTSIWGNLFRILMWTKILKI